MDATKASSSEISNSQFIAILLEESKEDGVVFISPNRGNIFVRDEEDDGKAKYQVQFEYDDENKDIKIFIDKISYTQNYREKQNEHFDRIEDEKEEKEAKEEMLRIIQSKFQERVCLKKSGITIQTIPNYSHPRKSTAQNQDACFAAALKEPEEAAAAEQASFDFENLVLETIKKSEAEFAQDGRAIFSGTTFVAAKIDKKNKAEIFYLGDSHCFAVARNKCGFKNDKGQTLQTGNQILLQLTDPMDVKNELFLAEANSNCDKAMEEFEKQNQDGSELTFGIERETYFRKTIKNSNGQVAATSGIAMLGGVGDTFLPLIRTPKKVTFDPSAIDGLEIIGYITASDGFDKLLKSRQMFEFDGVGRSYILENSDNIFLQASQELDGLDDLATTTYDAAHSKNVVIATFDGHGSDGGALSKSCKENLGKSPHFQEVDRKKTIPIPTQEQALVSIEIFALKQKIEAIKKTLQPYLKNQIPSFETLELIEKFIDFESEENPDPTLESVARAKQSLAGIEQETIAKIKQIFFDFCQASEGGCKTIFVDEKGRINIYISDPFFTAEGERESLIIDKDNKIFIKNDEDEDEEELEEKTAQDLHLYLEDILKNICHELYDSKKIQYHKSENQQIKFFRFRKSNQDYGIMESASEDDIVEYRFITKTANRPTLESTDLESLLALTKLSYQDSKKSKESAAQSEGGPAESLLQKNPPAATNKRTSDDDDGDRKKGKLQNEEEEQIVY